MRIEHEWDLATIGGVPFPGARHMYRERVVLARELAADASFKLPREGVILVGPNVWAAYVRETTVWGPAKLDPTYVHPKAKSRHAK